MSMNWKAIKRFFLGRRVVGAHYDETSKIMSVLFDDETSELYWGDCGVWHDYPMMRRCSSGDEVMLCDLWEYWRQHGNPYPSAHVKR